MDQHVRVQTGHVLMYVNMVESENLQLSWNQQEQLLYAQSTNPAKGGP